MDTVGDNEEQKASPEYISPIFGFQSTDSTLVDNTSNIMDFGRATGLDCEIAELGNRE
jgi:hypothetical protein